MEHSSEMTRKLFLLLKEVDEYFESANSADDILSLQNTLMNEIPVRAYAKYCERKHLERTGTAAQSRR